MKNIGNEIYILVDEKYLSKFTYNHQKFMKNYYYNFYKKFCSYYKRKALSKDDFFTNMHRRRIQLYQLCCPYCGTINLIPHDKKIEKHGNYNYCTNCGKGSISQNILMQVSRFIRITHLNNIALRKLKEDYPEKEDWLLAYDCYQMEIIELTSIIEVFFRDYFEALIYVCSFNTNDKTAQYIKNVLRKNNSNDFMNIEKANNVYKKAFGINMKIELNADLWNDLIDVVNLRNMMIHNNGMVDKKFLLTPTAERFRDKIKGNLICINDEDISKFLESVLASISVISNLFLDQYYIKRNATIANYYFNNSTIDFSKLEE